MRQRADAAAKPEVIMEAAGRLFAHFGYQRTSMEDIAKEVGVAKGTLYIYFPSKEALYRAILGRNVEAAVRLCDAIAAQGGDLAAQVFRQLEAWFGASVDRYGTAGNLPELAAVRKTVGRDIAEAADRAYEARLVELFERAKVDGEAVPPATGMGMADVVSVLLAAARGAKYSYGVAVTPTAYRESLRRITRVAVAAVSGRPGKG